MTGRISEYRLKILRLNVHSRKEKGQRVISPSLTLLLTQEKTTVFEDNLSVSSYHRQAAHEQGSQATGSHGSQPVTQPHGVASFAFRFMKNPPNGKWGPHATAQGSHTISQGSQATTSQGMQATISHGSQPVAQWDAANLAFMFTNNPPNGRNGR